jgi:predicted nucleic acid-binding Zn ribbon protein
MGIFFGIFYNLLEKMSRILIHNSKRLTRAYHVMQNKKSRAPEQVTTILERVLSSLNLGIKVKQYRIWEVWNSVVGEAIARQAQPQQIRSMVLWVTVGSSTWMQQLEFMKRQIVERINERIGEKVISDIRFRIGEITREE